MNLVKTHCFQKGKKTKATYFKTTSYHTIFRVKKIIYFKKIEQNELVPQFSKNALFSKYSLHNSLFCVTSDKLHYGIELNTKRILFLLA